MVILNLTIWSNSTILLYTHTYTLQILYTSEGSYGKTWFMDDFFLMWLFRNILSWYTCFFCNQLHSSHYNCILCHKSLVGFLVMWHFLCVHFAGNRFIICTYNNKQLCANNKTWRKICITFSIKTWCVSMLTPRTLYFIIIPMEHVFSSVRDICTSYQIEHVQRITLWRKSVTVNLLIISNCI